MVCLAWPITAFGLMPINREAHRVANYLSAVVSTPPTDVPPDVARHHSGIDALVAVTPSPWNHFGECLYLPNERAVIAPARAVAA
jgi:hypothetical protein